MQSIAKAGSRPVGASEPAQTALIERAKQGEQSAWARLYEQHFDGLFRHLRYLTGDPNIAEELCQDTFIQAMQLIGRFEGRARFSTWLHGIGLNLARNHWRSGKTAAKLRARLEAVEAQIPRVGEDPSVDVLREQRVLRLYGALDQLPEHLREAFILRDLLEMSPADGAKQVQITVNNFKVRASRARSQLQEMLGDDDRLLRATKEQR